MRALSSLMTTRTTQTNGAAFRPLMLITPPGSTSRLFSTSGVTVDGMTADPTLLSVASISEGLGRLGDVSIVIPDTPQHRADVQLLAEVLLMLWPVGGSLSDADVVFAGLLSDPIERRAGTIRFDAISRASKHDRTIGQLIGLAEFPAANASVIGNGQPIIYGSFAQTPCLPVNVGGRTTLLAGVTAADTTIHVTDNTLFTQNGTAYLDDELIHYSDKSGTTQLTGVSRAVNNTTATPHPRGTGVTQSLVDYTYLIAGHPIRGASDVRCREVGLGTDEYTLDTSTGRLVMNTQLVVIRQLTLQVQEDIQVTAAQDSHTHAFVGGTSGGNDVQATLFDLPFPLPWRLDEVVFPELKGTVVSSHITLEMTYYPGVTVYFDSDVEHISAPSPASGPWSVVVQGSTVLITMSVEDYAAHGSSFSLTAAYRTYSWTKGATLYDVQETLHTLPRSLARITSEIIFPALSGTPTNSHLNLKLACHPGITVYFDTDTIHTAAVSPSAGPFVVSISGTNAAISMSVEDYAAHGSTFQLLHAFRLCEYTSADAELTTARPSIATSKTGTVVLDGSQVVDAAIGGDVTAAVEGWSDGGALIERPDLVVRHLLRHYAGATNFETSDLDTFSGDRIAIYLNHPVRVRDLLTEIERQCRAIITWSANRWIMRRRPNAGATPVCTITMDHVLRNEDGTSSLTESRAGLSSAFNRHIWRAGRNPDDTWRFTGTKDNTASQTLYGVRDTTVDLPFIHEQAQAQSYIDWLSARQANPNRRVISFSTTLVFQALEIGDVVRIDHPGMGVDCTGEIVSLSRGLTGDRVGAIQFTVEEL